MACKGDSISAAVSAAVSVAAGVSVASSARGANPSGMFSGGESAKGSYTRERNIL